MYLFYNFEGDFTQRNELGQEDIINVVEGYLAVIKFENGKFYELTPIDEEDVDNWTLCEQ